MTKNTEPSTSRALSADLQHGARFVYALSGILVLALDQATKRAVERTIPLFGVIPLVPHCLNLTHTQNSGAAFGLFSDSPAPWKTALLIAISGVLLAAVATALFRPRLVQQESGVGLALIFGGALSNLLDRVRYGQVTDFLDLYVRDYHWYTFNLADSAIVVGAGLLALQVFRSK